MCSLLTRICYDAKMADWLRIAKGRCLCRIFQQLDAVLSTDEDNGQMLKRLVQESLWLVDWVNLYQVFITCGVQKGYITSACPLTHVCLVVDGSKCLLSSTAQQAWEKCLYFFSDTLHQFGRQAQLLFQKKAQN